MKKIFIFILLTITTFAGIGNIMAIQGDAQVNRETKKLNATNGMDLLKGDQIVTQAKTKVQVMLKDDTVITIGPNSTFSFVDYMYDGSKNSKVSMNASRGFFRSVTGKIGKVAPERFKVNTNLATIGIRGTDFAAQLEEGKAFYKCYSGEIKVSFADKERNLLAGEMLHLQMVGKTVKEMPLKKGSSITQLKKSASNTEAISAENLSDLSDISVRTEDIKDVNFDCETN